MKIKFIKNKDKHNKERVNHKNQRTIDKIKALSTSIDHLAKT